MTTLGLSDNFWGTATSSYQIEGGADEGGRGDATGTHSVARGPSKTAAAAQWRATTTTVGPRHRGDEEARLQATASLGGLGSSPRVEGSIKRVSTSTADWWTDSSPWASSPVSPLPGTSHKPSKRLEVAQPGYRKAYDFADQGPLAGRPSQNWITLNEPWCSAMLSHETGSHAPDQNPGARRAAIPSPRSRSGSADPRTRGRECRG